MPVVLHALAYCILAFATCPSEAGSVLSVLSTFGVYRHRSPSCFQSVLQRHNQCGVCTAAAGRWCYAATSTLQDMSYDMVYDTSCPHCCLWGRILCLSCMREGSAECALRLLEYLRGRCCVYACVHVRWSEVDYGSGCCVGFRFLCLWGFAAMLLLTRHFCWQLSVRNTALHCMARFVRFGLLGCWAGFRCCFGRIAVC
jgi:hypothetical protein